MKTTRQNKRITCSAVLLALLLFLQSAFGYLPTSGVLDVWAASDSVSIVESYYQSLDENCVGKEFRAKLAALITETHKTKTTYSGLADVYKVADADPYHPGNIIWFYTGESVPFSGFGSGNGTTNREHVWPKDGGSAFPETTDAGSDGHHLRPTEAQLNSTRGNKSFAEVAQIPSNIAKQNGSTSYANPCYTDGTFFYPGEGYRGATARILMYVQVRWGDQYDLKFVDAAGNCKTIGKISDLMKWHLEEPPTEEEIRRNEAVFQIQGNRNPFIDHPEYAAQIFCYDGESYNAALQAIVAQYGGTVAPEIDSVTLEVSSPDLAVGQSIRLNATVSPSNAPKNLVWASSDPDVVEVKDGVVTALKAGSATITVSSAKDPSVKASVTLNVKGVSAITVFGILRQASYTAGEPFDPDGLTVTALYTDGSTSIIPPTECRWLDATTGNEKLSAGTTAVICRFGALEYRISGITVQEGESKTVSITRADFEDGGSYGWVQWSDGGLVGKAFIYTGTKDKMQFNSSKTSYYLFNTQEIPGDILSITVKMNTGSKSWELRTSSTPFGEMAKYPGTGTSQGEKTVTTEGTTWKLNTTDRYFTLNYKDTGVAYLDEILIEYGNAATIPVEKHHFGEWIAEIPATCEREGTVGHYACDHCDGYFDADGNPIAGLTILRLPHEFGEWQVTKEPTVSEEGEKTRTCSVCGTIETASVAALPQDDTPDHANAERFVDAMKALHVTGASEADFNAIRDAMRIYAVLSEAERNSAAVTEAYAGLCVAMATYNAAAEAQNAEADEAGQGSVATFTISSRALGILLWLLQRKRI